MKFWHAGQCIIGNPRSLFRYIPLLFVMVLTTILNVWSLWEEGLGNFYYASAVKSMGHNLHAFFFNSLDSIGFVTVDKPPLGLWIQVLSTKIWGYTGFALLFPQALASILSVYLIYRFIGKRFGMQSGFVAALALAVTPIFVAVSRNNTMDATLIVLMLIASGQAVLAAEKSSLRHLLVAAIIIGLGFNVKMLQAYMVVPAIYLTYLVVSKQSLVKKIRDCAISFAVLVVISLSWITIVDWTPTSERPYIGSSSTNSAYDLAFGYNGLNRVFYNGLSSDDTNTMNPLGNAPGGGVGAPDGGAAGASSFWRLFTKRNAGQISWWLIPAWVVCLFMIYRIGQANFRTTSRYAIYLYIILCFIPMFIYFSFSSGISARYYFATFAPVLAILLGIGVYLLIQTQGKLRYLWTAAIVLTGSFHIYIHHMSSGWLDGLIPLGIAVLVVSVSYSALAIALKWKKSAQGIAVSVLLIFPMIWSFTPIMYGSNDHKKPIAGPTLIRPNNLFDQQEDLTQLIAYLKLEREGAAYLVAATSVMDLAYKLIIHSDEPVMVLGGFDGGDRIISVDQFVQHISEGKVKFAIINHATRGVQNSEPRMQRNSTDEPSILEWIVSHGELIDTSSMDVQLSLYRLSN